MIKFQNVAIAATVVFGLMAVGGCQTPQTGSSTHMGAQPVKNLNKSSKRVSRKTVSEDASQTQSKKSRRKFSLKNTKSKQASRSSRKGKRSASRRGRSYDHLIRRYARENGVPYALARAVVQVESGFRASARGGVGEIGLMQLRKSTARGMGYRGSTRALYNPDTNIKYGMRYLGQAYKLGGRSTCGAILKYNAGHGARRMNPVSRRYCGKVRRIMRGRV